MMELLENERILMSQIYRKISEQEFADFCFTILDLTHCEMQILKKLFFKEGVCSKDELLKGKGFPRILVKLKKKLQSCGIKINVKYGLGYELLENNKALLNQLIVETLSVQTSISHIELPRRFLNLTLCETEILRCLVNKGFVCSRDEILRALHQLNGREIRDETLNSYIKRMRLKLHPIEVKTCRAVGFMISAPNVTKVQELVTRWKSGSEEIQKPEPKNKRPPYPTYASRFGSPAEPYIANS